MARIDGRPTFLGMAAGVALALLAGCDTGPPAESAKPAASKKSTSAEEEEQLRYNTAVDALNSIGRHALSSARQYFRQFDPERGPTGRENRAFVDSIDHSWIREAIEKLKTVLAGRKSRDAMDEASARYVAATERLIPLTVEASRYYKQEDWRDDKFAKGKAMHAPLVAAYREFEAAQMALSAEVRRIGDSRREARLAKLKASGQVLRHDVELSLRQARDLLEFVEEQMKKAKRPQDMDLAGLKERIDAYDATLGNLRQALEQGPERAKKEFGLREHNFSSYVRYGDSLLLSMKDILRAGRDRKPMPVVRHPHSPGGMGYTGYYNDMVQEVNSMNH